VDEKSAMPEATGTAQFRRMYEWQVGRFFRDARVRDRFVPKLYEQFSQSPSAHEAFFGLNRDLRSTLRSRRREIRRLRRFNRPVRIVFGDADPYLNRRVAKRLHELLPTSELFLIPDARHFVQMDEPGQVARLILTLHPRLPRVRARGPWAASRPRIRS
jgi:pimeloyl-ACP methyl ester carboxylesterase